MAKKPVRAQRPGGVPAAKPARVSAVKRAPIDWLRDSQGRFTPAAYLAMNAVFWGFCILNLIFITQTLRESRGLYFFFGILMIGFSAVSVYDYLFDRLVPSLPDEPLEESGDFRN